MLRLYDKIHAHADGQGCLFGFILTGGEARDYNAVVGPLAVTGHLTELDQFKFDGHTDRD